MSYYTKKKCSDCNSGDVCNKCHKKKSSSKKISLNISQFIDNRIQTALQNVYAYIDLKTRQTQGSIDPQILQLIINTQQENAASIANAEAKFQQLNTSGLDVLRKIINKSNNVLSIQEIIVNNGLEPLAYVPYDITLALPQDQSALFSYAKIAPGTILNIEISQIDANDVQTLIVEYPQTVTGVVRIVFPNPTQNVRLRISVGKNGPGAVSLFGLVLRQVVPPIN